MIYTTIRKEYERIIVTIDKVKTNKLKVSLITYVTGCILGGTLLSINHLATRLVGFLILIVTITILGLMSKKASRDTKKKVGGIDEADYIFNKLKEFLKTNKLYNRENLSSVITSHKIKNKTSNSRNHILTIIIFCIQPLWTVIIGNFIKLGNGGAIAALLLVCILLFALLTIIMIVEHGNTLKLKFHYDFLFILQTCITDCIYNEQLVINKSKSKKRC